MDPQQRFWQLQEELERNVRDGDVLAAARSASEALQLAEENLGLTDPIVALAAYNLGVVYSRQGPGRYPKAIALYERAISIWEAAAAPDASYRSPECQCRLACALENLGLICIEQRDTARARGLLERTLEIRRRVQGDDHPETERTAQNLSRLLEEEGDT